ncbi:hypothetical protein [Vibrio splendidus]|uniref:hypothetical protein n=1 Tax=Vibrio splendidus TaxID=29497 RepID=UPI002468AD84|nr:hypothetical protein [Vibrio splendidus]MDH5917391.1 hypothetical protein [Vibrio splendidus]
MKKLIGKLLVLDKGHEVQNQLENKLSRFGLGYSFVEQKTEALQVLKSSHKNYDLLLVNCSEPQNHDIAKLIRDESKTFGFVNIIYYGGNCPDYLSKYVDCFILDVLENDNLYKNIGRYLIVTETEVEECDDLFSAFDKYSKENKVLMYQTIVKSMSQDVKSLDDFFVDNKRLGHKIKGTSEMIGAKKLGCLAKKFEVSHCSLKINNLKEQLIKEILNVIESANSNLGNLINEK